MAVSLTANLELSKAPGNVRIPAAKSGLPKDSVANNSQILTVDRDFLDSRVGRLSDRLLGRVEHGLRLVLGL